MPRNPDSGRLNLAEVFRRVQHRMLSDLAVGGMFEHASAAGAASEQNWLALFNQYLPQCYRSAPAFVNRLRRPPFPPDRPGSLRQPVFPPAVPLRRRPPRPRRKYLRGFRNKADHFQTMAPRRRRKSRLRPHPPPHLRPPNRQRRPSPSPHPPPTHPSRPLSYDLGLEPRNLRIQPPPSPLNAAFPDASDLGCSLQHDSFEHRLPSTLIVIFFMLRLFDRLRSMCTPTADLMECSKSLRSFKS